MEGLYEITCGIFLWLEIYNNTWRTFNLRHFITSVIYSSWPVTSTLHSGELPKYCGLRERSETLLRQEWKYFVLSENKRKLKILPLPVLPTSLTLSPISSKDNLILFTLPVYSYENWKITFEELFTVSTMSFELLRYHFVRRKSNFIVFQDVWADKIIISFILYSSIITLSYRLY